MKKKFLVLALAALGCDDGSGQKILEKELYLRGMTTKPSFDYGNAKVEVESVRLAFGPVYLCGGTQAGDRCKTARTEWLGSEVVELVGTKPRKVGVLEGLSGPVRSYMFDLGFVSVLTNDEPLVLEAARRLGGSVKVEAVVEREGKRIPFGVTFDVVANPTTGKGLPVVASPLGGVNANLELGNAAVVFDFDVERFLELPLEPFVSEDEPCSAALRESCHGEVFESCDFSGKVVESRRCGASEICVRGFGCTDEVDAPSDSDVARALRLQVLGAFRPELSIEVVE